MPPTPGHLPLGLAWAGWVCFVRRPRCATDAVAPHHGASTIRHRSSARNLAVGTRLPPHTGDLFKKSPKELRALKSQTLRFSGYDVTPLRRDRRQGQTQRHDGRTGSSDMPFESRVFLTMQPARRHAT